MITNHFIKENRCNVRPREFYSEMHIPPRCINREKCVGSLSERGIVYSQHHNHSCSNNQWVRNRQYFDDILRKVNGLDQEYQKLRDFFDSTNDNSFTAVWEEEENSVSEFDNLKFLQNATKSLIQLIRRLKEELTDEAVCAEGEGCGQIYGVQSLLVSLEHKLHGLLRKMQNSKVEDENGVVMSTQVNIQEPHRTNPSRKLPENDGIPTEQFSRKSGLAQSLNGSENNEIENSSSACKLIDSDQKCKFNRKKREGNNEICQANWEPNRNKENYSKLNKKSLSAQTEKCNFGNRQEQDIQSTFQDCSQSLNSVCHRRKQSKKSSRVSNCLQKQISSVCYNAEIFSVKSDGKGLETNKQRYHHVYQNSNINIKHRKRRRKRAGRDGVLRSREGSTYSYVVWENNDDSENKSVYLIAPSVLIYNELSEGDDNPQSSRAFKSKQKRIPYANPSETYEPRDSLDEFSQQESEHWSPRRKYSEDPNFSVKNVKQIRGQNSRKFYHDDFKPQNLKRFTTRRKNNSSSRSFPQNRSSFRENKSIGPQNSRRGKNNKRNKYMHNTRSNPSVISYKPNQRPFRNTKNAQQVWRPRDFVSCDDLPMSFSGPHVHLKPDFSCKNPRNSLNEEPFVLRGIHQLEQPSNIYQNNENLVYLPVLQPDPNNISLLSENRKRFSQLKSSSREYFKRGNRNWRGPYQEHGQHVKTQFGVCQTTPICYQSVTNFSEFCGPAPYPCENPCCRIPFQNYYHENQHQNYCEGTSNHVDLPLKSTYKPRNFPRRKIELPNVEDCQSRCNAVIHPHSRRFEAHSNEQFTPIESVPKYSKRLFVNKNGKVVYKKKSILENPRPRIEKSVVGLNKRIFTYNNVISEPDISEELTDETESSSSTNLGFKDFGSRRSLTSFEYVYSNRGKVRQRKGYVSEFNSPPTSNIQSFSSKRGKVRQRKGYVSEFNSPPTSNIQSFSSKRGKVRQRKSYVSELNSLPTSNIQSFSSNRRKFGQRKGYVSERNSSPNSNIQYLNRNLSRTRGSERSFNEFEKSTKSDEEMVFSSKKYKKQSNYSKKNTTSELKLRILIENAFPSDEEVEEEESRQKSTRRRRHIMVGSEQFSEIAERVVDYDYSEPQKQSSSEPLTKDTYSRGTSTEVLTQVPKRTSTTELIKLIKAIAVNTDIVDVTDHGVDPIPQKIDPPPPIVEVKTKFTNTEQLNLLSTGTDAMPLNPRPVMVDDATDPRLVKQVNKETNTRPEKSKDIKTVGTDPRPIERIPQVNKATDPIYYLGQRVKFTNTSQLVTADAQTATVAKPPNISKGTATTTVQQKDEITSYDKVKTFDKGVDTVPKQMEDKGLQFEACEKETIVRDVCTETETQEQQGKITQTSFTETEVKKPTVIDIGTQTVPKQPKPPRELPRQITTEQREPQRQIITEQRELPRQIITEQRVPSRQMITQQREPLRQMIIEQREPLRQMITEQRIISEELIEEELYKLEPVREKTSELSMHYVFEKLPKIQSDPLMPLEVEKCHETSSDLSMYLVLERCHEDVYKRRSDICNYTCGPTTHKNRRNIIVCENKKSSHISIKDSCSEISCAPWDGINNPIKVNVQLKKSSSKSPKISPNRSLNKGKYKTTSPFRKKKTKLSEACEMDVYVNQPLEQNQSPWTISDFESGEKFKKTKLSEDCGMDVYVKKNKSRNCFPVNEVDTSSMTLTSQDWKNIAEKVKGRIDCSDIGFSKSNSTQICQYLSDSQY